MADISFQTLPGFRDFLPRDHAIRQYLHETWRATARRHGFVEYETPLLEDTGLYLKKSGGELSTQLFRFTDQGERDVTLRPEVTASLARLAATHQRDFPKPLKWFEIGQCFRYEKPQKGRGREFFQFNADILGEATAAADAELLALLIDAMRALGFQASDYVLRVSDRAAWAQYAERGGLTEAQLGELLQIIDKWEREKPEVLEARLQGLGLSRQQVADFMGDPNNASAQFQAIAADIDARGLEVNLRWDLSIVRGLAYYTGVVFEVFDARGSMRAVAGGGRYDHLVAAITDGAVDLPATGFAMGDYVIRQLIEACPHALMQMEVWLQRYQPACDIYVVVADELQRPAALRLITELRQLGVRVDFPLVAVKMNKQLQKADQSGARFALIVGSEYPLLKCKVLSSRTEQSWDREAFLAEVLLLLARPDGPLLA